MPSLSFFFSSTNYFLSEVSVHLLSSGNNSLQERQFRQPPVRAASCRTSPGTTWLPTGAPGLTMVPMEHPAMGPPLSTAGSGARRHDLPIPLLRRAAPEQAPSLPWLPPLFAGLLFSPTIASSR